MWYRSALLLSACTDDFGGYGKALVRLMGFEISDIQDYFPNNFYSFSRSTERKRRQIYRSDVLEQVPFALRKMDEAVPTIDFTPTGGGGAEYTIERPDVDCE